MRAAVTQAKGVMELVEVPEPGEPGPGEVIVRPEAVGICGSDFHYFVGEHGPGWGFPRIQGHEVSGLIDAVGPDCREGLKSGTRVSLWPLTSCGRCYPCRIGRPNVCDNFRLIGIHADGGLQQRLRMPESQVFPAGDQKPAVATLAEPLSIAVRTVSRAGVRPGERTVVFGAGPIGQTVALVAMDRGASVLLIDRVRHRLEVGRGLGAETVAWSDPDDVVGLAREWSGGDGAPVVVDATGSADAIRAAVDVAASAARVVVVGISHEEVQLPVFSFTQKEFDLLGVSCCQADEFGEAVEFVGRHRDRLERLITQQFPLERAPEAFSWAMEHPAESMKVVIEQEV
jgi:threonine dehydrogenase-like Zn-dependent dehydrogenase